MHNNYEQLFIILYKYILLYFGTFNKLYKYLKNILITF